MSTLYRVGEGKTKSGKIIDKGTQWYTEITLAYQYAKRTKRNIYVSHNHQKFILWAKKECF